MNEFLHLSLFTGIGGFDLAAEVAGIPTVAHVEFDESKRELLKIRFPNAESHGRIEDFDGRKFRGSVNLISGGFPCQDISIAQTSKKNGGAQGIKGARSGLWSHYARIVGEVMPGIIVFENSSMLLSRGFEHVLCDLSKLGYDAEWRLFYASQFGFPHQRERLYTVAYAKCQRWHKNLEEGGILQKILPKQTSGQDSISMPSQRFNRFSNFDAVRMDDGFPSQLDGQRIHGLGNAIIPQIAIEIFEQLKKSTFQEHD